MFKEISCPFLNFSLKLWLDTFDQYNAYISYFVLPNIENESFWFLFTYSCRSNHKVSQTLVSVWQLYVYEKRTLSDNIRTWWNCWSKERRWCPCFSFPLFVHFEILPNWAKSLHRLWNLRGTSLPWLPCYLHHSCSDFC